MSDADIGASANAVLPPPRDSRGDLSDSESDASDELSSEYWRYYGHWSHLATVEFNKSLGEVEMSEEGELNLVDIRAEARSCNL